MSETRFQNTETALKNQQASIQGLETQIGQLSKLISERPQGSLPSNTEPNPNEKLNAISTQDKEGFVEPEPEPRQDTVVSKDKSEVSHNKMVNEEYKPPVPYPNATRKDRSGEQFGELTLRVGDETMTLQARNSGITSTLKVDTSPNQLKVGNKVLLDAVDPHIVTTTPNEEIPLTVLSIFPFGTVEVSHPKFGTFKVDMGVGMEKHGCARGKTRFCFFDTGMRHARAVKPWTTKHGRGTLTHGRRRSEQSQTRPCDTIM
ncbi:hypothetical protein GOBAR_AA27135 [Gossypium barbadense]|uniref:Uncharacterized protein n=1 Tax=Gossypium barbadense TaxID=3634 RepID=A0A2P5WR46_GOSBA|nr:hypothetical protein GOBAR_AA27135 [Gossypium barbadense]